MNTKWLKLRNKYVIIDLGNGGGKETLKVSYYIFDGNYAWNGPFSWENTISCIKGCVWNSIPRKIRAKHDKRRAKFNNRRLIKKYAVYPPKSTSK